MLINAAAAARQWIAGTRLGRALGTAVLILGALLAARRSGRRAERKDAARARLRRYRAMTRRMNDADVGNADPDDDREWLRQRGRGL